ncbi:putative pentatricopeptide repeat-containing protein At1g56570, partial [Asparagus officinalis]|uniref:putative pentatricopeptide repeat-containing protein At1g56570 n=1 Tax=Asparagus officinalis TaxID=4686 RepID=UPI00098E658D
MTKIPFKVHYRSSPAKSKPNPNLSLISCTNLIKSCCDSGAVSAARRLFEEMTERDVVVWTAMISGYTSNNQYTNSWALFKNMLSHDVKPNAYTLSSVLKACKGLEVSPRTAHGITVKLGFDEVAHVQNALIDAYAAMGGEGVGDAMTVFEGIEERNVVAWTTMIASYARWGDARAAIRVYQRMMTQEGAESNPFTSSIAIHACASMADLTLGTQLHCSSSKSGHVHSLPVSNAIIDLYFRCNCVSEAKRYFREMHQRDLVTWNTMIARLDQCGSHEAITLLSEMSLHSLEPNCFTFTSIVSACARLALLNCGQQVHASIIRRGFSQNLQVSNALVNMHTKCGSIIDSIKIFDEMSHKDIVSYTSMMVGYGCNGYAKEAIDLFEEMTSFGIQPDPVVFIGLLSACSHAGLVDEGLTYFNRITTEYNVKPNKEVYGCVVDLLGRAGRVEEAYELIESMPFEADESIWGALLGACRVHRKVGLGRL